MRYDEAVPALRAAGCVHAEEEARLLLDAPGDTRALVDRRCAGEPLEQVLGWAAFAGLRLHVGPGVFVPRRRTELLAREVIARTAPGSCVLELCCGVAPVATAVLASCPGADVHATDLDAAAVAVARRNVPSGRVHRGDLFDALTGELRNRLRGRIDVLAANTPYVPSAEIPFLPAEARDHEPLAALDGGPDGLALLHRIAAEARAWLAPGGHLLVEVTDRQLGTARAAFSAAGLVPGAARDEELGAVVVTGQLSPARRS